MTVLPFGKKKADPSKEGFDKFAKTPLWHAQVISKVSDDPLILVYAYLLYLSWQAQGRAFAVPNGWLEERGISRKVKARFLRKLEVGGAITVDRTSSKRPKIEFVGL